MKGGLTALSDVKQPSSQVINIDSSRSKLGHSHPLQRTSGFNGIGQSRCAKRTFDMVHLSSLPSSAALPNNRRLFRCLFKPRE